MVAMSGGVDSSVAALELRRAGFDVVGVTADLFGDASAAGPCCGRNGAESAAAVCAALGIEHHVIDMTTLFEEQVIERFLTEYSQGRTPNPCADCNRFIKFDAFFDLAREFDCALIATGHHARIEHCSAAPGQTTGQLCRGHDIAKDQSYFLAGIPTGRLCRIRFPVGDLTKPEVRRRAAAAGLPVATRPESQDVCFLPRGTGIRELLLWHRDSEPRPGRIVDEQGNDLGVHPGIEHYTIGQRKGLGLGGGTEGLVVHRLEPETNTVVLAQHDAHPAAAIHLTDFNDLAAGRWLSGETVDVRARYRQPVWPGRVRREGRRVWVEPRAGQFGIAPGQWLVAYRGDTVMFGGIIDSVDWR